MTTQEVWAAARDKETESLPDWYERWRVRIHQWISGRVDRRLAGVLLVVPDFFVLMVRLLRDHRVSRRTKLGLLMSLGYVLLPFDFLPEMLLGVLGLVDDASIMGLSLYGLHTIGRVDPKILREHWSGNDDVIAVINRVYNLLTTNFFGVVTSTLWKKFKANFRSAGAK
ncbi:MAG: DUF1232 domain-containing protein [Anaerolineae bacterium]|nr:DUF1232 domain-containing protein [Anaerolineae bacterium]